MKPDCYSCKYRGNTAGSAHSRCNLIREINPENSELMELLFACGQMSFINEQTNERLIEMNNHGIINGWAIWPMDFDPIWVDKCAFYTKN